MNSAIVIFERLGKERPEDFWAATNAVANEVGWKFLLASAYDLLKDSGSKNLWPMAIEVITCGSDQKKELPKDLHEFIARIHYCVDQCDELTTVEMDEQIWAFVSQWLGLPYTSDWSPYSDPDISKRMARMESEALLLAHAQSQPDPPPV